MNQALERARANWACDSSLEFGLALPCATIRCEGLPGGSAPARLYRIETDVSGFLLCDGRAPRPGWSKLSTVPIEAKSGFIGIGLFTGGVFCLGWHVRNREVPRDRSSHSLRNGADHPVWIDKNAAGYYSVHENTRDVAPCASALDGWSA